MIPLAENSPRAGSISIRAHFILRLEMLLRECRSHSAKKLPPFLAAFTLSLAHKSDVSIARVIVPLSIGGHLNTVFSFARVVRLSCVPVSEGSLVTSRPFEVSLTGLVIETEPNRPISSLPIDEVSDDVVHVLVAGVSKSHTLRLTDFISVVPVGTVFGDVELLTFNVEFGFETRPPLADRKSGSSACNIEPRVVVDVRLSAVFSAARIVGLTCIPFSEAVVATSPDEVVLLGLVIETDPEGVVTRCEFLELRGEVALNVVTVRMSKVTTPFFAVFLGLIPVHSVSIELEFIPRELEYLER